jgi:hypothetical protein
MIETYPPLLPAFLICTVIAAVTALAYAAAAHAGGRALAVVRLDRAAYAVTVGVVFFGLALIVAGVAL